MHKVAVVTGASRGIGAATAKKLASEGYAVCINFLKKEKQANALAEQIRELGGKAMTFKADVSKEQDVKALFNTVNQQWGTATHLVNNVGILFTQSKFTDISVERFQKVMDCNVLSCFLCCKAFINQIETDGAIVNVSSAATKSGSPFEYIDYAASKGAMDVMTKGLSLELAERNIRVNCVRPGFIHTSIHADGGEPERVERLAPKIPLKRGGEPEEVANTITWLLSDDASYITGAILDVAGGR